MFRNLYTNLHVYTKNFVRVTECLLEVSLMSFKNPISSLRTKCKLPVFTPDLQKSPRQDCTVKPIFRDHCYKRTPVLKAHHLVVLGRKPTFQHVSMQMNLAESSGRAPLSSLRYGKTSCQKRRCGFKLNLKVVLK